MLNYHIGSILLYTQNWHLKFIINNFVTNILNMNTNVYIFKGINKKLDCGFFSVRYARDLYIPECSPSILIWPLCLFITDPIDSFWHVEHWSLYKTVTQYTLRTCENKNHICVRSQTNALNRSGNRDRRKCAHLFLSYDLI